MPTWQNVPRTLHINAYIITSLCTLHCTYHSISESKLIEQSLSSGRGGEDRVLPAWTGSRHSVILTQLERVCDNKPCEYTCTFVYVYMYCHLHGVYMYVYTCTFCMRVYIYICMQSYMYMYMCICQMITHPPTHTHTYSLSGWILKEPVNLIDFSSSVQCLIYHTS